MAREQSPLKRGMGRAVETFGALVEEVYKRGGTDEDVCRISIDKSVRRQIAELLVQDRLVCGRYLVTVESDVPLADMIAMGMYDWQEPNINITNFPICGLGTVHVEIILTHFGRSMRTDDVLMELGRHGIRPAKIEELLALGASQPELQRQFPIIALGSIWRNPDGDRCVAYLGRNAARRILRLDWDELGWGGACRFAAVCESA